MKANLAGETFESSIVLPDEAGFFSTVIMNLTY